MIKKYPLGSLRALARIAAVVLLTGAATITFAQSENANGKKYVASKEIIFDKSTQTLRKPNAVETEAMVEQISSLTKRSTEGLEVNQSAAGIKNVKLDGQFNGVVLGRDKSDGTTEVKCVFTMAEAAEFLGLEETSATEDE